MTTKTTVQWWIDNMQHVALQLLDTAGDVVIFCNKGRSRSPMYLVAYLILIHCMTPDESMTLVAGLLLEQRNEILDRYGSLKPIVEHFHDCHWL